MSRGDDDALGALDAVDAVSAVDAVDPPATPPSCWADVDDPGPWAMQLALRYDPLDLPSHTRVCAAAARAVVSLLADERSRGGGEWAPYVRRWRDGRIRKLARRARGVRWDRVQELPGLTVVEGPAQVRAFVPRPARPLPDDLNALQVSGTAYPRSSRASEVPSLNGQDGRAVDRPAPVVVLALTPYAELSTGKAAAQARRRRPAPGGRPEARRRSGGSGSRSGSRPPPSGKRSLRVRWAERAAPWPPSGLRW